MQREIKFRAWDGKTMHEWGFLAEGTFIGPPSSSKGNFQTMRHMQFIGIKDKNGVEIYEGDILECNPYGGYKIRGEVKFVHRFFKCLTMYGIRVGEDVLSYNANTIKVIGNIYEHPNLLKETK